MATIRSIIERGRGVASAWRVERGTTPDGVLATCSLYHYSTRMLVWREDVPADSAVLDWSLGHGSVSDQNGMNTAFRVLALPYYYSRKGGADILTLNDAADRKRTPAYLRRWEEAGRLDLLPPGWPRPTPPPPSSTFSDEAVAERHAAALDVVADELAGLDLDAALAATVEDARAPRMLLDLTHEQALEEDYRRGLRLALTEDAEAREWAGRLEDGSLAHVLASTTSEDGRATPRYRAAMDEWNARRAPDGLALYPGDVLDVERDELLAMLGRGLDDAAEWNGTRRGE